MQYHIVKITLLHTAFSAILLAAKDCGQCECTYYSENCEDCEVLNLFTYPRLEHYFFETCLINIRRFRKIFPADRNGTEQFFLLSERREIFT